VSKPSRAGIADHRRHHHLRDAAREAGRQLLAEAEVEQADAAVGQHEQIARVRVAVEEVVLEDHRAVEGADLARDDRELVARCDERRRARHLDAVEVLEHDGVLPAQGRVDARDDDVGMIGQRLCEPLGCAHLAREVELELDEARDLFDHRAHVDAALHALDQRDHAPQQREVERDDARDLRVADLHDHFVAVA